MEVLTPSLNRYVLVVEDDADVRELAVGILAKDGYSVKEAASADEALRILYAEGGVSISPWWPTVVVLDVALPALASSAFYVEFRSHPRVFGDVPVLIMGTDFDVAAFQVWAKTVENLVPPGGELPLPCTREFLVNKVREVAGPP